MGLFSFLKPKSKPEPKPDISKYDNGIKVLHAGILFEDNGDLVAWSVPIDQEKLYLKKGYRADRTIYEWGERTILNGLKLPLVTVLWKHKMEEGLGVPSMEFSAEKEEAEQFFQLISDHLHKELGTPKNRTEEPGTFLEWKVGVVKLSLSLYEQYYTDRLHFVIDRV